MAKTGVNAAAPWTMQSLNNARNGRNHIGALFQAAAGTTGLTAWRDGVVCTTNQSGSNNIPSDLQVKASTGLNLTVEAGHCVITRTGEAIYLGYLATQSTVTLANADPSLPRIDLIVAQVVDTAIGDSVAGFTPSLSSPGGLVILPVSGSPLASPVAPTPPTGSIVLAQVAVANGASTIIAANISDKRKSASEPGGARFLLPGDSISDNGAVSGELRYSTDANKGGVGVWNGTAWQRVTPRVAPDPGISGGSVSSGGERLLASIALPDIGGAWYLEAGGHCNVVVPSGTNAAIGLQIRIGGGGSWDDNLWHTGGRIVIADSTGFSRSLICPVRKGPATLTGTQTIYLITKSLAGPAYTVNTGGAEFQGFNVSQIPAF